jgi:CBS domain-containing protein
LSFHLDIHRDTVEHAPLHVPLLVEAGASVREALAMLREQHRGGVLVCRDGVLAGILTERDVVRLLVAGADLAQSVEAVMSTPAASVEQGTTMAEAIRRMSESGYRRLPVLDASGRPVGLLKVTGIVQYLVDYVPEVVYNLPPQPDAHTVEREGP